MKKLLTAILAAMILAVSFVTPVWATEGYQKGKMAVLCEPDDVSTYVKYIRDGATMSNEEMDWQQGHGEEGFGLRLSGNDGLELSIYRQLLVNGFSFTAWVYWNGNEGDGRRLFTLYRDKDNWMSFSPWYAGTAMDGGTVNGLYLGVDCGRSGVHKELYHDTANGDCYALPAGRWHHVAVTSDGLNLNLYIDGKLLFTDMLMMRVMELAATKMYIGLSPLGEPGITAVVDDIAIYEKVLNAEAVAELVGTVPEEDPYIPVRPVDDPQEYEKPTEEPDEDDTVWGMPRWLFLVLAGAVVVGVLVLAVVSAGKGGKKA